MFECVYDVLKKRTDSVRKCISGISTDARESGRRSGTRSHREIVPRAEGKPISEPGPSTDCLIIRSQLFAPRDSVRILGRTS